MQQYKHLRQVLRSPRRRRDHRLPSQGNDQQALSSNTLSAFILSLEHGISNLGSGKKVRGGIIARVERKPACSRLR